jgi:hypothetical protein
MFSDNLDNTKKLHIIKGKKEQVMTRKLDKEHLDEIQSLRESFAKNANILGQIAIELHAIQRQTEQLQQEQRNYLQEYETLQETETTLIQKMRDRYGEGHINVVDGTFTPAVGLAK